LEAQQVLHAREQARAERIKAGEQQDSRKANSRGPQVNLNDPESGLMAASGGHFVQGYNVSV
jgi:hypothetical protein